MRPMPPYCAHQQDGQLSVKTCDLKSMVRRLPIKNPADEAGLCPGCGAGVSPAVSMQCLWRVVRLHHVQPSIAIGRAFRAALALR